MTGKEMLVLLHAKGGLQGGGIHTYQPRLVNVDVIYTQRHVEVEHGFKGILSCIFDGDIQFHSLPTPNQILVHVPEGMQ